MELIRIHNISHAPRLRASRLLESPFQLHCKARWPCPRYGGRAHSFRRGSGTELVDGARPEACYGRPHLP
jgi:hypothetical protein